MSSLHIRPDWNAPSQPFRHTWAGLDNVDQFRWMVRADMQDQLRLAHAELGTRHVRAVGMFDDELRVVSKTPAGSKGEPTFNFQILDSIIDALLDIGIHPMFTTTFMPGAFASAHSPCFNTNANTSPPKDPAKWRELIVASLEHFVARYGRSVMQAWYYEVWNEPNLSPPFFSGNQRDYFDLHKLTHDAIKSVDADFRVGGPSTARGAWLEDFVVWSRKNGCEPDYLITHVYNNDGATGALSPFSDPDDDTQAESPHFADTMVRDCRRLIDALDFKGELQWNEWGRCWFPHYPQRETANEAAFVVKGMAGTSQDVDQSAHWCLSDIYDQCGYINKAFDGQYGMMSLQGLRKPAWMAYQLLNRLSEQRIPEICDDGGFRTQGAIVTRDGDAIQALVYLYDHDDHPTPASGEVEVTMDLPGEGPAYNVTTYRVDDVENNVLHDWRAISAPDYLSREQAANLRDQNILRTSPRPAAVNDGILSIKLQNASIALIELNPA